MLGLGRFRLLRSFRLATSGFTRGPKTKWKISANSCPRSPTAGRLATRSSETNKSHRQECRCHTRKGSPKRRNRRKAQLRSHAKSARDFACGLRRPHPGSRFLTAKAVRNDKSNQRAAPGASNTERALTVVALKEATMATTEATRPAFRVQPAPALSSWLLALSQPEPKPSAHFSVPPRLRGRCFSDARLSDENGGRL
jgi:hypothetical protein